MSERINLKPAAHDAIVESHGAIKRIAASLMKIANDIRVLAYIPVQVL